MPYSFGAVKNMRLIGGATVLDFINTCNGRRPDTSLRKTEERLNSFEFFFEWALHADLISSEEYELFKRIVFDPIGAHKRFLESVIEFRESLFLVFYRLSVGEEVSSAELEFVNTVLQQSSGRRVLSIVGGYPVWAWKTCSNIDELSSMLVGRLAIQATELLTSPDLKHLKSCSSLECDWLFLDVSKNKQRRWCQMSVCGSREKLNRVKSLNLFSSKA